MEIGKYDITKNTQIDMLPFLKNRSFHGVDLDQPGRAECHAAATSRWWPDAAAADRGGPRSAGFGAASVGRGPIRVPVDRWPHRGVDRARHQPAVRGATADGRSLNHRGARHVKLQIRSTAAPELHGQEVNDRPRREAQEDGRALCRQACSADGGVQRS